MAKDPSFWKEFLQYAKERKKWFLIPIILLLLIVALLVLMTTSTVATPFLYTLF